jgi:hypothetical protein
MDNQEHHHLVVEGLSLLAGEALVAYNSAREKAELELASLCLSPDRSAAKFQELYLESVKLWDIFYAASTEAIEALEGLTS